MVFALDPRFQEIAKEKVAPTFVMVYVCVIIKINFFDFFSGWILEVSYESLVSEFHAESDFLGPRPWILDFHHFL